MEDKLRQIAALEAAGSLGPEQVELLREALGSANSLPICGAARAVRKHKIGALVPDLVRTFRELLGRPAKADKGCLAKTAVAQALNALDCQEEEPFLRGIRYRQLEPAYGRTIETAENLRVECAMGLARMAHPRAAIEILPLLVDAAPEARAAGVRALAYLGGEAGELLLRMKALVGDEQPAVVGECLSALMKMDPGRSAEFVAGFLESRNLAIVEEAAMALAGWQDAKASRILCECRTSRMDKAFREMMLVPIAMARCDRSLDLLYTIVADEPLDSALAAIRAAGIQRADPHWRGRIGEAVRLRDEAAVSQAYAREFGVGQ